MSDFNFLFFFNKYCNLDAIMIVAHISACTLLLFNIWANLTETLHYLHRVCDVTFSVCASFTRHIQWLVTFTQRLLHFWGTFLHFANIVGKLLMLTCDGVHCLSVTGGVSGALWWGGWKSPCGAASKVHICPSCSGAAQSSPGVEHPAYMPHTAGLIVKEDC